ncbi:hypothetical protein CONPUDRAFT_106823 [Coniophora puteana RWD-64-598 SS2]|uniref:Integral membrane protein n=1 Tax=Coniophora puteana (strain RWD-64-598) TaxID=741705 RepID=A0A5M3MIB6_CONPW|nr:uncharacterized protein CONPUDRAFT_106823 [Coniophora puteana RWD-64-598 SS2]EIW78787.1 hypothetical protein CONPUDRAFT_106823 [Coniophora puteana RWD-64-598 SS2]
MPSCDDAEVYWPSLYNPSIELSDVQYHSATQPGGAYICHPGTVFRFILYWTLIFSVPFYVLSGIYAFFNFAFPPRCPTISDSDAYALLPSRRSSMNPLSRPGSPVPGTPGAPGFGTNADRDLWRRPPRTNVRRSRITFAVLVLLMFSFLSLAISVLGAAVVGFLLFAVYQAGGFYMSTWVPFVWAVIQGLVALLGIWPSVIDIM